MEQESGYAIVKKAKILLSRYENGYFSGNNAEPLKELRTAFQFLDFSAYRGISRDPLASYPSTDENIVLAFRETGVDMDSDGLARKTMRYILGDELRLDCDNDLLSSLEQAQEVFELLDSPQEHEIIYLRRNKFDQTDRTLGYDIGYWGGDHYSLICDTVVMPTWHPPEPEDWGELAEKFKILNSNLLFSSPTEAEKFKAYYKTKEWAETETNDEFCIIQVDEVAHSV